MWCGGGRASATTAERSTCIAAQQRWWPVTAEPCPTPSTRCWRCRASGRTQPAPCWPSRSSATSVCSMSTRSDRCPASLAGGHPDRCRQPGPSRSRLDVEPGGARPRGHRVPPGSSLRLLSAGGERMPVGSSGPAAARPVGARPAPIHLRRLGPAGPRPLGRRTPSRSGRARVAGRGDGLAARLRPGRPGFPWRAGGRPRRDRRGRDVAPRLIAVVSWLR